MGKRTRDEETWQLAGMRAGMKAVDAGLHFADAPAETMRRARNYVRRLQGVSPAERAKRAIDYAYWFLDTVYEGCYWRAYDAVNDVEAAAVSQQWDEMNRAHSVGDIAGFITRNLG